MMNKHTKIFSKESACLSEKEIMDYVHDRLSMKERNQIERHMHLCELCSDAMDGYALMKDEKKVRVINYSLTEEIKNKSRERINWFAIAAAFTAAVLLVGSWYWLNKGEVKKDSVAISTSTKDTIIKSVPEINKEDTIIAIAPVIIESKKLNYSENSDGVISPGSEKKEKLETKSDVELEFKDNHSESSDVTTLRNAEPAPQVIETDRKAQAPVVANEESLKKKSIRLKEEEVGAVADKKSDAVSIQRSSKDKKARYFSVPSVAEKAADYPAGASKPLSDSVVAMRGNSSSEYELGKSYYELSEYKKAKDYLEKVSKSSSDYEEARWLLANSYLKLGDKNEAKIILDEIVDGNGKYKINAEEELKKLK